MSTGRRSILLAEDDSSFGGVLRDYLSLNDFEVRLCADGEVALSAFESQRFDLVITDVMMPLKDGFSLAEEIRGINPDIPLIFLTARTQKADMIRGYRAGADDYITKPFDSEILLWKINAVLNRSLHDSPEPEMLTIGLYRFHPADRALKTETGEERLSPREADLLKLLASKQNQVVSRQEALKQIWGDDSYFNARSMDVYVTRLRRRLAKDPAIKIESVYGTGIRLVIA
jgi:two-component system, OmpR family, response regulator